MKEQAHKYLFKIHFLKKTLSGKGELLLFCWKTVKSTVTQMLLSTQNPLEVREFGEMQMTITQKAAGKMK